MILPYLIEKELIQIRHNQFLPKLILLFPLLIMLVIPWITNMEVKNIYITVVDNDHSVLSQKLIGQIQASAYFKFKGISANYKEALAAVEKNDADVILVIPPNYERDRQNSVAPQVMIAANAVNGTKGGMGTAYLTNIVGRNLTEKLPSSSPFSTVAMFNPHKDYKVFMIPALMSMVIIMLCGFLPALNIVSEKEAGTIEQINVTPVTKFNFILAKLIPYWLIAMFVLAECFVLSWLVYDITPAGNIGLLFLLAMLLVLIFSGLGLIVSNYSDAMQQAMFVMWFIMVCFLLLSGLFTPVSSMPHWAQTLTLFNPLRYFIDAMRTVFIRGGSLTGVYPHLLLLTVFAVVIDIWAMISYKKTQ